MSEKQEYTPEDATSNEGQDKPRLSPEAIQYAKEHLVTHMRKAGNYTEEQIAEIEAALAELETD